MKVIVNTAGFYGGAWYEAGAQEREIADKVAKPFLPPYGDQLSKPVGNQPVAPVVTAPAAKRPDEKKVD